MNEVNYAYSNPYVRKAVTLADGTEVQVSMLPEQWNEFYRTGRLPEGQYITLPCAATDKRVK